MDAKGKRNTLIVSSIILLGGAGFLIWWESSGKAKFGKKEEEKPAGEMEVETPGEVKVETKPGSTGSSSGPTATQTALATAYRAWANSTDELKAKYGKTSTYKLDASNTPAYNSYFTNSYAAGKADYEKSLSGSDMEVARAYLKEQGKQGKLTGDWQHNSSGDNPGYIIPWYNALRAGQATFVFIKNDGTTKMYRSDSGNRYIAQAASGAALLGKTIYPSGSWVRVRSIPNPTSSSYAIGIINSPNAIGKVKNYTLGPEGKTWYEVDLLTTLSNKSANGEGSVSYTYNQYAKNGWVRSDVMTTTQPTG